MFGGADTLASSGLWQRTVNEPSVEPKMAAKG